MGVQGQVELIFTITMFVLVDNPLLEQVTTQRYHNGALTVNMYALLVAPDILDQVTPPLLDDCH